MTRRLLLVCAALLAGSAVAAPAARAQSSECNRFIHCTVYGPDGEPITSYDEIRETVDRLRPGA